MNGKALYAIYAANMNKLAGCLVDEFEDLEEGDKEAWDATAEEITLIERGNSAFEEYVRGE